MTSIDELFKKPGLPLSSHKRKFEAPDAQQAYKATKLSRDDSPNGRTTTEADPADDDDLEAGPALPPSDDDDGDDDEGRFFGTGMTHDAAEALNYIDAQQAAKDDDDGDDETIDLAWLRRLATSFERKAARNAELRAKHADAPQKFMASEAELDAEVKRWSLLAEHPELYGEFARLPGAVAGLVGVLAHENTDVAIGALEILAELLDEEVRVEDPEAWETVARAMLDDDGSADLVGLLRSNLARLDEEVESDRGGVYHCLAVMEGLAGVRETAEGVGRPEVLMWLCERIKKPESPVGQNKQYAAEVLQVLLQSSPVLRRRLAVEIDGVDLFLQLLALYRKRVPPKDTSEEEYVENIYDALTCVVDEPEGKTKFVEAEGVELMLIVLKEGRRDMSHRALRVLDHALGGRASAAAATACEKLVEAGGLKRIFSIFMKKADNATTEHLLGIFAALLRLLPGESAARIRTLAKFTESDGEKVIKLVERRRDFARRVAVVDKEIRQEQRDLADDEIEERADEWFSRRLDGGLFCLQTIDVILAWLIAEEQSIKGKVAALLDDDGGLATIKASLAEQKNGLDTSSADDEDTRDMLETLESFLA